MTFLHSVWAAVILVPAAGLLAFGCAGRPDESDDAEDVGEVESAYGEATCGTTSNIDVTDPMNFGCGDSGDVHTSSSSYGHPDCTHAYIVKYTGSFVASGYSVATGVANTQATCNVAHAKWSVYNSSGTLTGSSAVHGSWDTNLNTCNWLYDSGKAAVGIGSGSRVVAEAYTYSCGVFCLTSYIPVEVVVYTGPC